MTLVQASFGASRQSAANVEGMPAPDMKAVEECPLLPYIKGVTPEFMRHMSMAWAVGALPFTGRGTREMGGWVRFASWWKQIDEWRGDRGLFPYDKGDGILRGD